MTLNGNVIKHPKVVYKTSVSIPTGIRIRKRQILVTVP